MAYAKSIFLAVLFFIPSVAFANVIFTEVMYDVPGTDTGREWVEFQNTGTQTIDLSGWKFFEANTNHSMTLSQGAGVPPGGYAVIADVPSKFLADWPSYSGTLFDTTFSLSNTGESLVLRDNTGADAASVTYDPTLGAGGDGNSLQWNGSKWVAAPATPGSAYVAGTQAPPAEASPQQESDSSDSQDSQTIATSTATSSGGGASYEAPKNIFADAGPDRTVFVGADSQFTATAIGLDGEPLDSARYTWTFGDGGRLEGQTVSYHYSYPGTYTVMLDVSSGKYAAEDRMTATAIPAQVSLPIVNGEFVSIKNGSPSELDLGGWLLASDGKSFVFPAHTIVSPGETVIVSGARTGLAPSSPSALSLLYPNGTFAASYEAPLVVARVPATTVEAKAETVAPAQPKPTKTKTEATTPTKASDSVSTTSQAAAVILAGQDQEEGGGNNIIWWIAGLGLLAAAGVGALFFFPYKGGVPEGLSSEYVIKEK